MNPTLYVRHYPSLTSDDEDVFINSIGVVSNNISELCGAVAAKEYKEEEERFIRGEIEYMSSRSAYLPGNTLHVSLDV